MCIHVRDAGTGNMSWARTSRPCGDPGPHRTRRATSDIGRSLNTGHGEGSVRCESWHFAEGSGYREVKSSDPWWKEDEVSSRARRHGVGVKS